MRESKKRKKKNFRPCRAMKRKKRKKSEFSRLIRIDICNNCIRVSHVIIILRAFAVLLGTFKILNTYDFHALSELCSFIMYRRCFSS